MLQYFSLSSHKIEHEEKIDADSPWIDLFGPEAAEIHLIENLFQLTIPSIEDMGEIEASSRLFEENERLYMTINVLTSADSEHPYLSPITFILDCQRLITVRYVDPKPFQAFTKKLEKNVRGLGLPELFFLMILEAIIDRIADIFEVIGSEIDSISSEIFKTKKYNSNTQRQLHEILTHIGKRGDLCTKTRESLTGIGRMLTFFSNHVDNPKIISRMQILQNDASSIADHVNFLFGKINFLLDATLGYINIEQNNVVKILSVAAVIFLPPTLIASIYGMNFAIIPELRWGFGYPLALSLMVVTAILPYFYFKRKGWL